MNTNSAAKVKNFEFEFCDPYMVNADIKGIEESIEELDRGYEDLLDNEQTLNEDYRDLCNESPFTRARGGCPDKAEIQIDCDIEHCASLRNELSSDSAINREQKDELLRFLEIKRSTIAECS